MKMQTYSNFLKVMFVILSTTNIIFPSIRLPAGKNICEKEIDLYSKILSEVFKIINTKAYFPINFTSAMNKALDSLVHCDEYSHFLGPQDYQSLLKSTQGQFYGVGIAIAPKKLEDDFLLVLKILQDSPAYRKNIQRFDKIIAINGEPVGPLTTEEATQKLRGDKRYSKVTLDVIRNTKDLISITVERDIVKENEIISYYITNKQILYSAISNFTYNTALKLRNDINKALKHSLKGIILDLRDNPGGILESAIDCASIFLKNKSLVVITKNRYDQVIDYSNTKREPIINKPIPIIILVNNYTASAAEILAGALQDHASKSNTLNHNIFLLGTETYGKSFVQEVIPLSNNCALKITTCLYCLPNGKSINKTGIKPDFAVRQKYPPPKELEVIDKLYGKGRNSENLNKKLNKTNNLKKYNWEEEQKEKIKDDYQVKCALNLIELLNLGKKINKSLNTQKKAKEFLLKHSCLCSGLDLREIE